MGACTSASDITCVRKKYSNPNLSQLKNVKKRPTQEDLSSSMDNNKTATSTSICDQKAAHVGIYFIREELITKLSKG
jgi:hypothetical protein